MTGGPFLAAALLAVAVRAWASPPERAAILLDPAPRGLGYRGAWGSLGGIAREALPGASEWRLAGGIEPRRGVGLAFSASVLSGVGDRSILGSEVRASLRRNRGRFALAAGESRRGSRVRAHAGVEMELEIGRGFLLGLGVRGYPGERGGAPAPGVELIAARDAWVGRIELGQDFRGAWGVRLGPHLWWTARLAARSPSLGLAWRVGSFTIRAEEERHPHLGRVSRIAVAVGGERR